MKKAIYGVAILCMALFTLTSCPQPGPEGGNITGLTVKPAETTISLESSGMRLSYVTTPAGAKVKLNWTSSDEKVATVDEVGYVRPIGEGTANITATDPISGLSSICVLHVATFVKTLKFTEAYVGILEIDSTKTVKYFDERFGTDSLNARICKGRIQLFTEGLYFDGNGQLNGATEGGWIYMTSPICMIHPNENPSLKTQYPNGVSFSLGAFKLDGIKKETSYHHAEPGTCDNDTLMKYYNLWFDDFKVKKDMTQENYQNFAMAGILSFKGTTLSLKQYTCSEENECTYEAYPNWLWKYVPNALIMEGGEINIGSTEGSSKHMHAIDYMNVNACFVQTNEEGIPGIFMERSGSEEDPTFTLTSTGLELGEPVNYVTGTKPEQSAPGLNIFIDHCLQEGCLMPELEQEQEQNNYVMMHK